jgi:hypothetical protein
MLDRPCLVFARRFAVWAERGRVIHSPDQPLGFAQANGFVDAAGLLHRTTVTVGSTWLALLAARLLLSIGRTKNGARAGAISG